MLLLTVAITKIDKLENKVLPHFVKYCSHMNSKFDYSKKIDSILMALRYIYSIYSDHWLAHMCHCQCYFKYAISCGQHVDDNKLLLNYCLQNQNSIEFNVTDIMFHLVPSFFYQNQLLQRFSEIYQQTRYIWLSGKYWSLNKLICLDSKLPTGCFQFVSNCIA